MTDDERYLFDLHGYLRIENAIEPGALRRMNDWLDAKAELDPKFTGQPGSDKLLDVLTWNPDFLNLLDNARVLPYLKEILGNQLRLDHEYAIFLTPGGNGLALHGGGTPYDPSQFYHVYNGRIYSGLAAAVYSLVDVPAGLGGFACLPGSHKSAFPCPRHIRYFDPLSPAIVNVPAKAGDCILFTEALTHGTLPWRGDYTRRTLFFKYGPNCIAWERQAYSAPPAYPKMDQIAADLTETQRVLLQPPSISDRAKLP